MALPVSSAAEGHIARGQGWLFFEDPDPLVFTALGMISENLKNQ